VNGAPQWLVTLVPIVILLMIFFGVFMGVRAGKRAFNVHTAEARSSAYQEGAEAAIAQHQALTQQVYVVAGNSDGGRNGLDHQVFAPAGVLDGLPAGQAVPDRSLTSDPAYRVLLQENERLRRADRNVLHQSDVLERRILVSPQGLGHPDQRPLAPPSVEDLAREPWKYDAGD
jgi:hypothetical protein